MTPDDDARPDDYEDADPMIRELRAEIVRLEAQLDQLAAAVREQAAEAAELRAMMADLERRIAALLTRRWLEDRVLVWLVPLVWAAAGASAAYLFLG